MKTGRPGRLAGEIALVTGSTSGLGAAIAECFAENGASVVVTGRDDRRGRVVVERICDRGGRAAFFRADITIDGDRRRLVEQTCDTYGGLSVLVNNAFGLGNKAAFMGPLLDVTPESWRTVMSVGLEAVAFLCQAVLPVMLAAGRGSIVNVSSRTAEVAAPGTAAYTVAKGALGALTRAVTADYTRHGVRCNTLLPGYILHEERDAEMPAADREAREAMQLTRLSTSRDVANAALFLASQESATVAGAALVVDGGQSVVRGLLA